MAYILHDNTLIVINTVTYTINDESLEWLKFGGFGELINLPNFHLPNYYA